MGLVILTSKTGVINYLSNGQHFTKQTLAGLLKEKKTIFWPYSLFNI